MNSTISEQKISFTENYNYLANRNKIVLINNTIGSWIKISSECFDILNEAIESDMTYSELENHFEDDEDKKYISLLLHNLLNAQILKDSESQVSECYLDSVDIMLTERCNLFCKHCAVSAGTSKEDDTDTIMNTIKKVLECNPVNITLTGGEPTLRNDFYEIINYIIDANCNIKLN